MIDLERIRIALSHLKATRRAGPEFETHQRYSFTNLQDAEELERAIEILDCFLDDFGGDSDRP